MEDTQANTETGLPHQKKAWSQHDLLESALGEYLHVIQKNGGRWPSWKVSPASDDIHDDLVRLNTHLERLGWMGKLTQEEEWVVTVFPAPERQFPQSKTVLMFWVLSFFTITLAGDHWMSNARPSGGWFHASSLIDALLGFTLPIMLVLVAASYIQRHVSSRYGVRSGHLMPVPDFTIALYALGLFPSSWLFWPFGLLLIPTMPRMDARPWPNRASLGFTALTVPLVLGVSGVILMVAGLLMTPEYLPSSRMPLASYPPLFLSLFLDQLIGNDSYVRLLWANPWTHAGGMLMLFAWVSVLPIPTFPGGRLLIARIGLIDARSSGTQSLIMVTLLFCAYVFGVFEQFSLWFLIFALLLPLLFFFGNDLRIPLILDETEGLSEADHGRMGLLLLLVFLFLLPAAQPVLHETTWDDPMTHELKSPSFAEEQEDGTWLSTTKIQITNPSALMKPFAIAAFLENPNEGWSISWDCDGEDTYDLGGQGCGSDLLPKRTAFFWMNLTWDKATKPTMANLSYVVEMNGDYVVEAFAVRPALEIVPGTQWYDVQAGSYTHRCVDLDGSLIDSPWLNLSVSGSNLDGLQTTLVNIAGQSGLKTNLSSVPDRFCLEGLDPLVFEPQMATLTINNDTFAPLLPQKRPLTAYVPDNGWDIHGEDGFSWEALLGTGILLVEAPHCPINASIAMPVRPKGGGDWKWDMNVRTLGETPSVVGDEVLTLLVPPGKNLSRCDGTYNPYPSTVFTSVEGPELLTTWMNTTSRFWTTPWAIATNGTSLNTNMTSFTIHNPSNVSVPIRLERGGSFGDDWAHNWDGGPLAPGDTVFELTPPNAPLATMYISFESGSVVLHLASYQ